MTDPRPVGLFVAILGVVGTTISALADPLGIGEGEVFGWLQTTGVVLGAIMIVIGVALALEWVPFPGRTRDDTVVAGGGQNTTIVTERRSDHEVASEKRTDPEPH
jgi:hypothetical protein